MQFGKLPLRVVRALADPARTRDQAIVAADVIRFRKHAAPFRDARPVRDRRGVALIVSMSHFVYQLKLEVVLAKALELEGYEPVFVANEGRWPRRYFAAAGFDRSIHLENYLGTSAIEADDAARAFLAGDVTVQGLKQLSFHDVHVGQQTLSSLSRRFQSGRISLSDPGVRAQLGETLAESMRAVLAAERLLAEVQPEVVIFNEKGYAGVGSIYDVALARGANVINFVSAGIHSRDGLIFKRYTEETRRVHPTSLSAESWEIAKAMPWGRQQERELDEEFVVRYGPGEKHPDAGLQEGKAIEPPEVVRATLGLDPAKRTAVVFSHVLWDANLFYGRDLFEDQEAWLVETVRAACANANVNWLVKLHPANAFKSDTSIANDEKAILEAIGELPSHVRLIRPNTRLNTFSLFAVTDVGVTIRGTIGMELPCFGVPVLTAGTGRYSGLGFTIDSETQEEYLRRLAEIQSIEPLDDATRELGRRHAYAIFRLRPLLFTTFRSHFKPMAERHHPLAYDLELTTRTRADVQRAQDLKRFARWALDRDHLDYLELPRSAPAASVA